MIITEWFSPAKPSYQWFGQTSETLAKIERGQTTAVASVIGPPGRDALQTSEPIDLGTFN